MSKFYIHVSQPNDWKNLLADPDKHWKPGYSAYCIDHAWQGANDFPVSVRNVFNSSGIELFNRLELLLGFPEHKVPLPGGERASQNDIFILAKGMDQLISIAVEGKVSESFGPTISDWKKDFSSGKQLRLSYLLNQLMLPHSVNIDSIRYQLLHRSFCIERSQEIYHPKCSNAHSFI